MRQAGRKVGLLHHIGGGNLGDDATQDAVMQSIGRRWPDAVMIGFSMNPDDTEKRHGIPSHEIRRRRWSLGHRCEPSETTAKGALKRLVGKSRLLFGLLRVVNAVTIRIPREILEESAFLFRSYRAVKSLDLLVINGGGQLTEWGGPWEFPYTIFKWITLAKVAGVRRVFLNVGAGPLTRPLSKFFVRRALGWADYASFRDEESRALVRRIGFTGRSQVFPDSAYSLETPAPKMPSAQSGRNQGKVGLAPMPYCDPRAFPDKDQIVYDEFIRKLGRFGSRLVESGYRVALFGSDIGVDPLAIADLHDAIRTEGGHVAGSPALANESVSSLEELLARMSLMDYVVTCRFHGVVFAHLLNKPVLAISHHPKVAALMSDIGLGEYCMDIRTFDPETLTETFAAVVRDADEIRRRMASTLTGYRAKLR
ncbi:MAG TPA: polysaccharide pyruvyl transferase family protein, partial [Candidatus Methylomirabilis sp.]|nr:polysaccharide pyruvyl transferase family protein [Candidatus Methylomirabilis sp.]